MRINKAVQLLLAENEAAKQLATAAETVNSIAWDAWNTDEAATARGNLQTALIEWRKLHWQIVTVNGSTGNNIQATIQRVVDMLDGE